MRVNGLRFSIDSELRDEVIRLAGCTPEEFDHLMLDPCWVGPMGHQRWLDTTHPSIIADRVAMLLHKWENTG